MIPNDRIRAAVEIAKALRTNNYFTRVATGDERAASLFARLVAFEANPGGATSDFGWLRKTGGGFNVEGFADGAIVYGNDPNDRHNVLKIVTQIGSDHAGIGDAEQDRRESDVWFAPHALTVEEMRYLNSAFKDGDKPTAGVPSQPAAPARVTLPGRQEMMEAGDWLDRFYGSTEGLQRAEGLAKNGRPDWEGVGAWLFDVYLVARIGGKDATQARAAVVDAIKTTGEWQGRHPNG